MYYEDGTNATKEKGIQLWHITNMWERHKKQVWSIINSNTTTYYLPTYYYQAMGWLHVIMRKDLAGKVDCYFVFANFAKELARNFEESIINQVPCFLNNSIGYQDITCEEITWMIRTMPWERTPENVGCSVNVIKDNIDIFSLPLENIYNQAFYSGTYPELLQIAKVLRIYKKDDMTEYSI